MKVNPIKYYCELYNVHYEFYIGISLSTYNKITYKKYGYNLIDDLSIRGHCSYCVDKSKNFIISIWVPDKKDLSAVVHECVHAANFTLESRGVKPCFDNDEPQAYLVQLIFNKATKK